MRIPASLRLRFSAVSLLTLVTLLVLPGSAFATKTLGLSAGTFHFNVSAGQIATGEVIVMNDGTEPLKVMVYAADQSVDAKGNITYSATSRADIQSLGQPSAWTTIKMPANSKSLGNIPYLELTPGQKVPVRFAFTVPPNVLPGDHNVVIFFESFEPPAAGSGAQSVVSGRLGTRVTLEVKGELVKKLDVRPYNVPAYVIGGMVPYDFTVRNVGNVDQRVGARVLLLDRTDNEVLRKTAIDGLTAFAGNNLESSGTVVAEKSPVGLFKLRLDVSPVDENGKATNSGADTITEEHQIWLIPIWFIVLVGVIILLVIMAIIWRIVRWSRRRKRKREEEAYRRGVGDAVGGGAQAPAPSGQPAPQVTMPPAPGQPVTQAPAPPSPVQPAPQIPAPPGLGQPSTQMPAPPGAGQPPA